jgi:kynurenine formamidase
MPELTPDQRGVIAAFRATEGQVTMSPFGPSDEIGMLNLITPESRAAIINEADATQVFDLAVEYFMGMPGTNRFGDPAYQIFMTHTPAGTVIDDLTHLGTEHNERVSYSGDAILMYTHTGTHIDTLNHIGYHGRIWNGFQAQEHLGSRHWDVAGADRQPPIVARAIVLDIAAMLRVDVVPPSYAITPEDVQSCLKRQKTEMRFGDVVLIHTGRMTQFTDRATYMANDSPGLVRESARFIAEGGAIAIGSDTICVERRPSPPEHRAPVHTYLLTEAGVPMIEMVDTTALAQERVYECAFVAAPIRLKGATGAPIRPVAFPLRSRA